MPQEKRSPKSPVLVVSGAAITLTSIILLAVLFYPALTNEFNYRFHRPNPSSQVLLDSSSENASKGASVIVAKDKDFSIVIPKIGANAKVIANVDPLNSEVYQKALTQGVAHAKGTALPDQPGNVFLFAHSSDTLLNANAYNAVFYLLNKLEPGDFFYVAYKEKLYKYRVERKRLVDPTEIKFYGDAMNDDTQTATLMTCWPPATTLKRLIVLGKLES